MFIIGVAGQKQNGKDTLADYLRAKLNDRMGEEFWTRSAFAKAVKEIFCSTFNKDPYFVEKWKVREDAPPDLDKTVRQALQFIGDGFRQIKGSIWIDIMFRDKKTPRIVSDCRYVNELRAVKQHGGFVILVVRPDMINDDPNGSEAQMRPFAQYALDLSDERPEGWELVDMVVINNGDMQDLYKHIDDAVLPAVEAFFQKYNNVSIEEK